MRTRVEKLRSPPLPAAGPKVKRRHFRIGVLVDEERQRFEVLRHLRRHAHGQRHQRRVLRSAGDFEHDHAVLGLDGAIAEGLLLERRPDIFVGLRRGASRQQSRRARQRRGIAQTLAGARAWRSSWCPGAHYITPIPALRRPR